jgi:hypothetical protein
MTSTPLRRLPFFLLAAALVAALAPASVQAQSPDTTINQVAPAVDITVNGESDGEYINSQTYVLDEYVAGGGNNEYPEGSESRRDLRGEFQALWTSDTLYYFITAVEDSLEYDTEALGDYGNDDDSYEIYLDGDNSDNTDDDEFCQYDGLNDFQYIFHDGDETAGYCNRNGQDGPGESASLNGINYAEVVDSTDGANEDTVFTEVAIPWNTIGVTPAQGDTVGTDVQFNEHDDGDDAREYKIAWADGNDDAFAEPVAMGDAVLADESGVVPVEFAGAPTPSVDGDDVTLAWRTLSETNNAGFFVQHKREEASGWTTASDLVPTKAEGGTASGEIGYRHEVTGLAPGRYQFRIQQKDLDGDVKAGPATKLIEVVGGEEFALKAAHPNPLRAGETAVLDVSGVAEDMMSATLYNSLGQEVRELSVDGGEITVAPKGLSSGLYFVRLESGENTASQSIMLVR